MFAVVRIMVGAQVANTSANPTICRFLVEIVCDTNLLTSLIVLVSLLYAASFL